MEFIKEYRVPLFLALLKFLLPYLLQDPAYELHRDEYLYLAEAKHLAWGFMEVPPFLSILAKITDLFGNGFFWVKFWPSLFGGLTVFVVCQIVKELGGGTFAQCIASLCMIIGVYLRTHFLFQPNFLEIFWWSLIALLIVKYINSRQSHYIILMGVCIGLAWLSKYSIAFFVMGIIAGMLLTPHRKLFFNKHIYWAAAIALLIALPNILWQYNHRWPVIHHMKELRETQLRYVPASDFLMDQLLMQVAYCFIWLGGLTWLLFSRTGKPYRILGWIYLTVIAVLIISSGKSYYSLGAYPMLIAAGGTWLEKFSAARLIWVRYVAVILVLVLTLPIIPILLPVWEPGKLAGYYFNYGIEKIGVLKWEDLKNHPLPQDFADMLGWKELSAKVTLSYHRLPDGIQSNTMIHCRNYGQAGAITYYGKGLPQVNTDNASFLLWMPEKYNVKNILLVARQLPGKDDTLFRHFEKYLIIDSITNPFSREFGTKIFLFENADSNVNALIEADVRKQKNEFRR